MPDYSKKSGQHDMNAIRSTMDRVRDYFLYFIALVAAVSVVCAVYQAMNDKVLSATTLGAFFLVGALLLLFSPQLEVLKAWGVEAKLTERLGKADEIIARLRRLSIISAKATYTAMAWGSRMGAPSAQEKQTLLDEIDQQLASLDVSQQERAQIVRGYVKFIGLDYFHIFVHVLDRYIQWRKDELGRELQAVSSDERRKQLEHWSDNQRRWHSTCNDENVLQRIEDYGLDREIRRVSPTGSLPRTAQKLTTLEINWLNSTTVAVQKAVTRKKLLNIMIDIAVPLDGTSS